MDTDVDAGGYTDKFVLHSNEKRYIAILSKFMKIINRS